MEGLREVIRTGQGQLKDTASKDPNIDKETYVLNWRLCWFPMGARRCIGSTSPAFAYGGGWESTGEGVGWQHDLHSPQATLTGNLHGNRPISEPAAAVGMNGWTILKTATPQIMAAFMAFSIAMRRCQALFSLEVGVFTGCRGASRHPKRLCRQSRWAIPPDTETEHVRGGGGEPSNTARCVDCGGDLGGNKSERFRPSANPPRRLLLDVALTIPTGYRTGFDRRHPKSGSVGVLLITGLGSPLFRQ